MNPHDIARPGKEERGNDPASHTVWDHAYLQQGRLWGGVPSGLQPLPLPPRSRVLELGCGDGKTAAALSQRTESLIALDASPHACRLARKQLRDGSTADILVADARAIPLTPGSVDAVIAHHITGHLLQQDRLALVNETTRVLKQGGLFLFCDFSIDDFRCGNGSEIEEMTYRRGNGIITHYFTEEEVRAFSPLLILKEIRSHRGSLRVRGENHPRAEIIACFTRV